MNLKYEEYHKSLRVELFMIFDDNFDLKEELQAKHTKLVELMLEFFEGEKK